MRNYTIDYTYGARAYYKYTGMDVLMKGGLHDPTSYYRLDFFLN